ncbi:MAG: CFI-box-CTERM domain-containing protein [Polyangia bacterium]
MRASFLAGAMVVGLVSIARAQSQPCRTVEVTFEPIANLQIAVWIEDPAGHYVDTAYVSRLTGTLGLANRPGDGRLKTDFRFPYGRRDMVLPVWAHERNQHYGYVVMGGNYGNSIATCGAHGIAGSECDDETIGYHFDVSSPEPFYCSPRGGVSMNVGGVDVVSCASPFYGSKGAYADPPAFSLYPPRADLTSFTTDHDGADARAFSTVNDLGAISGATPPGMQPIDPPIRWSPPHDGDYVLKVEVSEEADFNMYHRHPNLDDEHPELNIYGHDFLGQPSIVYAVPFTVGAGTDVELQSDYAGYGDWDGATGALHPPDMTITTTDGSGAGRLILTNDASGAYRVKVRALPTCDGGAPTCTAPSPPTALTLTPNATSISLSFASAIGGTATNRFDVRYRENAPITDADFLTAIPSSTMPPPPGPPGTTVSTLISGLRSDVSYTVAVRALAMCDAPSKISASHTSTLQAAFVTLHGCFIATAAYGTPLARQIEVLRRFRDHHLLDNPLGQLAVAAYVSLSPPVASAISSDEHLRAAARWLVSPLVELARAAHQ